MNTCRFVPSQKNRAFTLYRLYAFSTWWRLVPNMDSSPSQLGGSFWSSQESPNRNRPGKNFTPFFPGDILDVRPPPSSNSDASGLHWEGGPLAKLFLVSSRNSGFPGFPREFPPSSSNKKSWTWHSLRSLTVTVIWHTVDGSETLHQLIGTLSHYSIISKVLYIPGGCLGFLPSTVSNLQKRTRKTWFQNYTKRETIFA